MRRENTKNTVKLTGQMKWNMSSYRGCWTVTGPDKWRCNRFRCRLQFAEKGEREKTVQNNCQSIGKIEIDDKIAREWETIKCWKDLTPKQRNWYYDNCDKIFLNQAWFLCFHQSVWMKDRRKTWEHIFKRLKIIIKW